MGLGDLAGSLEGGLGLHTVGLHGGLGALGGDEQLQQVGQAALGFEGMDAADGAGACTGVGADLGDAGHDGQGCGAAPGAGTDVALSVGPADSRGLVMVRADHGLSCGGSEGLGEIAHQPAGDGSGFGAVAGSSGVLHALQVGG